MGSVVLEAMALRLPIVATRAGGLVEVIEDGRNGFLFPPEDAQALAEKIVESLKRPDLRAAAREINIGIVRQRAHWDSNIKKLLGLYEKITHCV